MIIAGKITAMRLNPKRITALKEVPMGGGPVVYWMSRDQRAKDNWALLHAQDMALERKAPLLVVFCLVPQFLGATLRQYDFMLRGLREVESSLTGKGIPFVLLAGNPEDAVPAFLKKNAASALVTDFSPLRIKSAWDRAIAKKTALSFHQVDAHNIVPCREASPKLEYAAYTIRPKIRRALKEFLTGFPRLRRHPHPFRRRLPGNDWTGAEKSLKIDRSVSPVRWLRPGEKAAMKALQVFIREKLPLYPALRNDPMSGVQSNLSPYLHFGQISAQRCALEILDCTADAGAKESFLEELVVRRELSENLCFYNEAYDSFEGFPRWAKETLDRHRRDKRTYLYGLAALEGAHTHDELWNAAQREMVITGKMHGYLRMYWAKKILEWSASPEEALTAAIFLNDRYELDGRDPNGYAGIAWSIGGTHDRAWAERPVFGKIRYMSYNGCRTKFDIGAYADRVAKLENT